MAWLAVGESTRLRIQIQTQLIPPSVTLGKSLCISVSPDTASVKQGDNYPSGRVVMMIK